MWASLPLGRSGGGPSRSLRMDSRAGAAVEAQAGEW